MDCRVFWGKPIAQMKRKGAPGNRERLSRNQPGTSREPAYFPFFFLVVASFPKTLLCTWEDSARMPFTSPAY
jgi:hypothetical protein